MEKPSVFVWGAAIGFVALVITKILGLSWLSAILLAGLIFAIANIAEKDREIKSLQEDRDRLAEEKHQLELRFGLARPFNPVENEADFERREEARRVAAQERQSALEQYAETASAAGYTIQRVVGRLSATQTGKTKLVTEGTWAGIPERRLDIRKWGDDLGKGVSLNDDEVRELRRILAETDFGR